MGRYIVTGAAGFIGARTAELLLEEGHEVVGVDSLNAAYDVRVKRNRLERLAARPNFDFETGDIAERSLFDRAALREGRFDGLLNLAARAGVRASVDDPWVYVSTNATGTLNCLEFCRRREIGKLVLASTSSLYGTSNEVPYTEDQDTSRPISPYAASKAAAEAMAHAYHALHGIDVTVLRYFTVYGPAGRPDMSVFRFTQRVREGLPIFVYGDGSMSRDFTYVDDIARGTIKALKPLGFEIVNLGSDRPYTVKELIEIIEASVGKKAVIEYQDAHPADVPSTWAAIEKAARVLDWQPQVTLQEGVARAVAWYEAEREWAKDVKVY
ncbi:MAG: SDR family NAD(P)-dependent oxidoreductase [Myxococcota bacterium]|nr:SDR family NAD(P)-dependent oxidoreductase [Myxococcota bacterium]